MIKTDKETEIIELLLECLKYCDFENDTPYLKNYELHKANIHQHIGDVYKLR